MFIAGDESWNWFEPRTWPFFAWWMVLVLCLGYWPVAWRWWQKQRGQSWPTVPGKILYGSVEKKSGGRGGAYYNAQVFYEYLVDGLTYTGKSVRRMSDEDDANELIREIRGYAISVHVNPAKPKSSWMSDEEIDRIAAERPPDASPRVQRDGRLTALRAVFALPLAFVALTGIVISGWIHYNAIMGKKVIDDAWFFAMHFACIVLFFPAIYLRTGKLQGSWKQMFNSNTRWLQWVLYVLGLYSTITFLYFMPHFAQKGGAGVPVATLAMFSTGWVDMFVASFAMLWTSANPENELQA
jgi:hypothetical protein